MHCVVTTKYPNGTVKLSSEKDHETAICNLDPFWWIVPGEPEGSLLFCEVEESLPSTLRSPPSLL